MALDIGRREFIAGLGGGSLVWPVTARSQHAGMPVIGYLNSRAPGEVPELLAAFRQGLKDTGFVEGQNVTIEYRFAWNQNERLPALAADLVRRQVTVIVSNGPGAQVAKAATTTIPIAFMISGDPVAVGLVASLNRPGGNVTGVTDLNIEVEPKRLELAHELVPTATVIAVLINPTSPIAQTLSRDLHAAARTLGLQLQILQASTEHDLDSAFAALVQMRAGALVISSDPFFSGRSEELAALGLHYAVPAIYQYRPFAATGGLASYGGSITDSYSLAGGYVGRILKGEKPADLPVQQSTKVELIVNLKTAKALGLTVPLSLLGRADEVID